MRRDPAQHLAVIERLRSRAFPAEPAAEPGVTGGPGYHLAELAVSEGFWADDGSARPAAAEQYRAEGAALSALLTARWGEPQLVGMQGVLLRAAEGGRASEDEGGGGGGGDGEDEGEGGGGDLPRDCGELAEPWRELSATAAYAELWRAEGRWIALTVADRDPYQPLRLLAAVTVNDPP